MTDWNNYIMRKYGKSIRAKVYEAYERSFAKATIISRVNDHLLTEAMKAIPEKSWKEAG